MVRNLRGNALRVGGFIAACGLLMGATGAYAASGEELQFILNTFSFSHLGRARNVDVRGLYHARSRDRAHQERLDDLPQEHRALCDCRDYLLLRGPNKRPASAQARASKAVAGAAARRQQSVLLGPLSRLQPHVPRCTGRLDRHPQVFIRAFGR